MKVSKIKSAINIFLLFLSFLLFFSSVLLLILSFFTLADFFFTNIQSFNKIQQNLESNELILYNPGLFNIKKLDLSTKIYIFNNSFNFLSFNCSIKAKESQKVFVEKINSTLIENRIKDRFLELLSFYNDVEKVKSEIQKEIEKSMLFGNLSIEVEEFLKINMRFELNFSNLVWK